MESQEPGLRNANKLRHRSYGFSMVIATGAILVVLLGLTVLPRTQPTPNSGRHLNQSNHTITLTNDTGFDGIFEAYVFGDYTNTTQTIGLIDFTESATVTLPARIDSSYVFSFTYEVDSLTGYSNSNVTEDKLGDLDYEYRYRQDDMGMAVIDPADWPTPDLTQSFDISALPTSTEPPNP